VICNADVSARIVAELERGGGTLGSNRGRQQAGQNIPAERGVTSRPLFQDANVILLWPRPRNRGWAPRQRFPNVQASRGSRRARPEGRSAERKVYFVKQLQVKDENDGKDADHAPCTNDEGVHCLQCGTMRGGCPDGIRAGKPMRVRNSKTRGIVLRTSSYDPLARRHSGRTWGSVLLSRAKTLFSMPAFQAFKGADHFYNTAFHELTH